MIACYYYNFIAHGLIISLNRVTYIAVLKLEAAVTAQTFGNGQVMVLKVNKFKWT